MAEQTLIPKDTENNGSKGISVDIDHNRLRYFFYMMNGEPARRTESLHGAIAVSKSDVEILVECLIEKLKLSQIRDFTIKIGVGFSKVIIEKSFDEFKEYQWNEPNPTKEVVINIKCMIEDYETGNPLNHSMLIRIAKKVNPANMLQILTSNDSAKIDDIDSLICPVFCRTEYLHDELSKSLMTAVTEWHGGLKQPPILSKAHEFVKKHKQRIARTIHYLYPLVLSFFCIALVFLANKYMANNPELFAVLASIVIGANYLIMFFTAYGARRARKIFEYMAEISSQDVIFDITRGDDKESSERINENAKMFSSARSIFVWSILQNLIVSLIAGALLYLLHKI
jgi:hypothetical protein